MVQVTTDPKTAAKRKLQKNIIKKDSRKRKNAAFAWVALPSYAQMVHW